MRSLIKYASIVLPCVMALVLGGCDKNPAPELRPDVFPDATAEALPEVERLRVSDSPRSVGRAPSLDEASPANLADAVSDEVTVIDTPPNREELQDQAAQALQEGDVDTAYRLMRVVYRQDPENPQAIFLMARVFAEKNRFRQAIQMLDDLAESVPDARLPALGQTAEWLVVQGDWQQAEERYRKLMSLIEDSSMVDRLLSRLLLRQGYQSEVEALLRKLVRSGNVEEMDLRVLLSLAHPLPGDAETEPFEPIGIEGHARHEMSLGNWDAAGELLQESGELNARQYALLGRVLARQADFEQLASWARDVPASVEKNSDYWFASGVLAAHGGDHDAAVQCFARAVLRDQTDAFAYRSLSKSLAEINAEQESKMAAERALLIEQTQAIGDRMAASGERDIREISSLITLLEKLRRPFESLGWRAVQVVYGRASAVLSEDAAREVLAEINQRRTQQLQSDNSDSKKVFVLCGVELDEIPRAESQAK